MDLSPWSPNVSAWLARWYTAYGTGWCACTHRAILFHRNFSPTKKLRETSYLSVRVCLRGNKEHPIMQVTDPRKLAVSLGVSKTTVQRWIVDSIIRVHCNSLKPVLTEENKVARLIMVLEARDPQDPSKFLDMMDRIHVYEKWFFLSRQRERYLLLPEEKNPKQSIKSKSHITKVMFLCAVACPRFNPSANSWWDGKLGIWPIGGWEPAQRASKN